MKKKIIKIIVNSLTLTRIMGSILLPFIFNKYNALTSTIILAILFATDSLDGILARKYKVSTKGGYHLDQFCDKVLGLSVIITLIHNQKYLVVPLILELSIGLVNALRASKGETGASSTRGKIKTFVLSVTLVLALINVMKPDLINIITSKVNVLKDINFTISNNVVLVTILLTAILELAALIGYIKEALEEMKHPTSKPLTNEKVKTVNDIKSIVKRLWNEEVFLVDRDKPIQQVIQEELVIIHNIKE